MEELENALPLEQEQLDTPQEAPEPDSDEQTEGGASPDSETAPSTGEGTDQEGEEEHHPDPEPEPWPICLGIVGTVYKGEYDESIDYLDRWQTTYDGSTYIAMRDNPDKPPFPDGKNWIITAKGYPEAHYVRFIKGEASEDWYEGEVTLTKADFDLDHVDNLSLEEILEHCVTGISVNQDPIRRGEIDIDIVNKLSINGGEPMVGEVNIDVFTALTLNGNELPLESGSTDIKALESLLVNEHIEVPNQEGIGHLSLSEGLIINDTEIQLQDYKQNIALTFNGVPLNVETEEGLSVIDIPLSINTKPIEDNNFIAVQSITVNKKGPQVMIDGNVDLDIIEGVRVNELPLVRDGNELSLRIRENGHEVETTQEDNETIVDIQAVKAINVNGKPILITDGLADLVIAPSSIALTGICESQGEAPDKVVIVDDEDFELTKGKRIEISFLETNTATDLTLNINDCGAYPVLVKGRAVTQGMARSFQAGGTYSFLFDGEHYVYLGGTTPLHDCYDVTLQADAWIEQSELDETYYIATIELEGLEADDYLNVNLSGTKNILLVKDYKQSGVWAYEQADGSVTLAAEVKPSLDWPLHIEITQ